MFVTFRIVDTDTRLHSTPAPLNARELAALCNLLRDNAMIPDLDEGETEGTAYHFEVNPNALPLASFARALGYRTDIIAVVEEAQFLGRSLRVERAASGIETVLRVSNHIALSPDLMMTGDAADRLLKALGLDSTHKRTIRLEHLQSLMSDPATYGRFEDLNIDSMFEPLACIALADCGNQSPRLEWA